MQDNSVESYEELQAEVQQLEAQHSAAAKAAVAEAAARLNSEEATSATLLNFVDRRFPDGLPPAIKQKLESVSAKLEAEWQQLQKRDP